MDSERLEAVLDDLHADLPVLCVKVADLVHEQLPAYQVVSDKTLALAVRRSMATAIRALRVRRIDSRDDLDQVAKTIRERHEAGIPLEETVRAFALCIWQIHQKFLGACTAAGLTDELMGGSNILWWLEDEITSKVVTMYNELNLRRQLIDIQQRADFVRRLLTGLVTPSEMRPLFEVDAPYAAVRCQAEAGFVPSDQTWLEDCGSLPHRPAVLALVDGEFLGVVAQTPAVPPGVLVGLGPLVPLARIAHSFGIADRICHVSHHLGLSQVQTLDKLTWRVAAVGQAELSALVRERYLDPLRAEGAFGKDVEVSLRNYFAHRLNLVASARDQNMHVNTLRYRLRRFSDMTGANLDEPKDRLDLAWALEVGELPPWTPRL
ncbi:MAG: helix-turn-helix domain-containing protein [Propionibacteriaceae bacterium]|jgi:putative transposase|nr:helix-turn-helix domain-containing protein [Propionibacteriaceae bacterium]